MIASTLLHTSLLRTVIDRDSIGKVVALAFTISLITLMNYFGSTDNNIKIWYWIACLNLLIVIVGLSRLILNLKPIKRVITDAITKYLFSLAKSNLTKK